MKPYLVALGAGLLGILLGEQIVPLARRLLVGRPVTLASVRVASGDQLLGPLPHRRPPPDDERAA